MRYLKLYEEFIIKDSPREKKIGDRTIDYALSDEFFKDIKDGEVSVDKGGVYTIKNWKVY